MTESAKETDRPSPRRKRPGRVHEENSLLLKSEEEEEEARALRRRVGHGGITVRAGPRDHSSSGGGTCSRSRASGGGGEDCSGSSGSSGCRGYCRRRANSEDAAVHRRHRLHHQPLGVRRRHSRLTARTPPPTPPSSAAAPFPAAGSQPDDARQTATSLAARESRCAAPAMLVRATRRPSAQ